MTDDIVERLRNNVTEWLYEAADDGRGYVNDAPFEAADEIERLRAELAAVTKHRDELRKEADMMHDEYKIMRAERDAMSVESSLAGRDNVSLRRDMAYLKRQIEEIKRLIEVVQKNDSLRGDL